MKFALPLLLLFSFGCSPTAKLPKELKSQKPYLFAELLENELYLNLPRKDFILARPNATSNNDGFNFREIYIDVNFSDRFETVIYYFDAAEPQPLYEFILMCREGQDADAIAKTQFGAPNHKGSEWRFLPKDTGLPFTIGAWTFKNKIIFAGTIVGTEWEKGF
jgi:hypothetical protein